MDQNISTAPPVAAAAMEAQSAVSWAAVFAGAVVALALAIVLSGLAAGFGLKLGAPWLTSRASLGAFTPTFGALAIVVQVVSCGLGGYLAGRLRTRWSVHTDEVHFRDTAHGLMVWAVATVAGVVLTGTVLGPYMARLDEPFVEAAILQDSAATTASPVAPITPPDPAVAAARMERAANIAAQASFFMAIGLLLSAFTASVAAAIGGLRRDEMHGKV